SVKEAVFPFAKFAGVDTILGPEMKSTGEAMGIDRSLGHAFAKAQLAAGNRLPPKGRVFVSVRDQDKDAAVEVARRLTALGFEIVATRGTAAYLAVRDVRAEIVNKVLEGPPHVVDRIEGGGIQLVINTTSGAQSIRDSFSIRRSTLERGVAYFTTMAAAVAATRAIESLAIADFEVRTLQEYHSAP
ncbi:MAG: carbamoyl phosphate synthase large subunit, partial [Myxococcota bacterium]